VKRLQVLPLVVGLCLAVPGAWVNAQGTGDKAGAPASRAQVKMERDEFLKTHRWDEVNSNWVLKSGVEPPSGVKPRAEVRAERDEFLRNERWDTVNNVWVPLKAAPRETSKLTRAQVRAETRQFMRTHRWDEESQTWVEKAPRKAK
jgi:hypothetical protein